MCRAQNLTLRAADNLTDRRGEQTFPPATSGWAAILDLTWYAGPAENGVLPPPIDQNIFSDHASSLIIVHATGGGALSRADLTGLVAFADVGTAVLVKDIQRHRRVRRLATPCLASIARGRHWRVVTRS